MRPDLLLHALCGFVIALTGCFLSRKEPIEINLLTGLLASIIAGFGKELVWDDWLDYGTPDRKDSVATVWGGMLGAVTWLIVIELIK